ncbi:MAG: DUF1003 domain-containing protein [Proteobacteria bacterium]|nr:DUF1003 domain-containing protein [Pseudomonadota bacterium]
MPCDPGLLEGVPLFERLDEDDRRILADAIDLRPLAAGATLFRTGDAGDSLYVVHGGQIELFIRDTAGQKIVLTIVDHGEVFGELSMLDQGARTATAIALSDAELLELDRDDLLLVFRKSPEAALGMLAAMGHMTRKADALLRTRVSRNANEEVESESTFGERVADKVAAFGGSWAFIFTFSAFMIVWMGLNVLVAAVKWDEYPFILLNLILSSIAALQAPVIMMSQNRQAAKDRLRSDIEYEVNVKAELEIAHLHEKTDQIHAQMHEHFAALKKQLDALRPSR